MRRSYERLAWKILFVEVCIGCVFEWGVEGVEIGCGSHAACARGESLLIEKCGQS